MDLPVNIWSIISQLKPRARCPLCAAAISPDSALCECCLNQLPLLGPTCPRCALPLALPSRNPCGECLSHPPAFDRVRCAYRYQAPLDDLLARFKYHHHLPSGRVLAHLMTTQLTLQPAQIDYLLPMPLHTKRLQKRGFNQTAELTRYLAKHYRIRWSNRHLLRIKPGASQRETGRAQRWANVSNAFTCHPIQGRIAIVDDVVTTGATARAAAQAVKQAGAEWVEIWALARTPRSGQPPKTVLHQPPD